SAIELHPRAVVSRPRLALEPTTTLRTHVGEDLPRLRGLVGIRRGLDEPAYGEHGAWVARTGEVHRLRETAVHIDGVALDLAELVPAPVVLELVRLPVAVDLFPAHLVPVVHVGAQHVVGDVVAL